MARYRIPTVRVSAYGHSPMDRSGGMPRIARAGTRRTALNLSRDDGRRSGAVVVTTSWVAAPACYPVQKSHMAKRMALLTSFTHETTVSNTVALIGRTSSNLVSGTKPYAPPRTAQSNMAASMARWP
jgi:hypothetical protein